MFRLKKRMIRLISGFLLVNFLFQLFFPTVALALTGGPMQLDTYGYQPVSATDNVNLVTGAFNYSIPVPSVPEYPMAYSYRSGLGMDDEASAFGFGGNCFSGAINRGLQGLPDDVNGATVNFNLVNQSRNGVEDDIMLGSISAGFGYDNYEGYYGTTYGSLTAGISNEEFSASTTIGLSTDTRTERAVVLANTSVSFYGISLSATYTSENKYDVGLSAYGQDLIGRNSQGFTVFGSNVHIATSKRTAAMLPGLIGDNNFGTSGSPGSVLPVSKTSSFYEYSFMNELLTKNGFGTLYLGNGYDRSNTDHYPDIFIENEDPLGYFRPEGNLNPVHIQRDFYTASGGDLSGTMQLYNSQYGMVSRAHGSMWSESIKNLAMSHSSQELSPWTKVTRQVYNKNIDMAHLLTDMVLPLNMVPEEPMFIEETFEEYSADMTSFDPTPELVFRGETAPDLRISATAWSGNKISAPDISISTAYKDPKKTSLYFMGAELKTPTYFIFTPDITDYTTHREITTGNQVKYTTIGEMITAAGSSADINSPSNNEDFFNSFFIHYTGNTSTFPTDKTTCFELTSSTYSSEFNLLYHLKNVETQSYFNDLIGSIEVKNKSGFKYYYNLPVFAKGTRYLSLTGRQILPPATDASVDDYVSFYDQSGEQSREKVDIEQDFYYPYAWNLTAIVGPDYIDFDNVPGPSDGDIGYWVRFKYIKAADDYRWRTPFTGLDHTPDSMSTYSDDTYHLASGTKEIYYLKEVESSTHISKYTYYKRYDGVDAKGFWNGDAENSLLNIYSAMNSSFPNGNGSSCAYNTVNNCKLTTAPNQAQVADPTGSNYQFVCSDITLYSKFPDGDHSKQYSADWTGEKVRSFKFYYDYSTCPQVPNNLVNCGFSPKAVSNDIVYHTAYLNNQDNLIENGKLTLRKIQECFYDEQGQPVNLPSYDFKYGFDANTGHEEYNPAYDAKQVDQWGNYSKNNRSSTNDDPNVPVAYYHHYTELTKSQADLNAQAFMLSSIGLPLGGSVQVDFEAKDYGRVEDEVPYVMRQVVAVSYPDNNTTQLQVDITDLIEENASASLADLDGFTSGSSVYGEIAFYDASLSAYKRKYDLYIASESATLAGFGSITQIGNRYYQYVTLTGNGSSNPFYSNCTNYEYHNGTKMLALKEASIFSSSDCGTYFQRRQEGQTVAWSELPHLTIANIVNLAIDKSNTGKTYWQDFYNTCYGTPCQDIYVHYSFLRTPVYKAKYSGSRVESIRFTDGFSYATLTKSGTTSAGQRENTFGTVYTYEDTYGTPRNYSSGVASCEPNGKSSQVTNLDGAQGAGFMPAPLIYYGKTTVEPLYKGYTGTDKLARQKGKTVYEFYTPADAKFDDSFTKGNIESQYASGKLALPFIFHMVYFKFKVLGFRIKIPVLPVIWPVNLYWLRRDFYQGRSYAYLDRQDLFGQFKKISYVGEDQKYNYKEFTYYDLNEDVNMADASGVNAVQNPGYLEQNWSETFMVRDQSSHSLPGIGMEGITNRYFNLINQKYVYVPVILKQIESQKEGVVTTLKYSNLDKISGRPVLTEYNNSYGDTKKVAYTPAYWKNTAMGSAEQDASYANMLTQNTARYDYVRKSGETTDKLTGAAVTVWGGTDWDVEDAWLPQKLTTTNSVQYQFSKASGIKNSYTGTETGLKIPSNAALFRPNSQYVYRTTTDADGVISNFTDFDFTVSNQTDLAWTLTSKITLFDHYGSPLEVHDNLNKYAATHIGYNFSHKVASVSNGSYKGSVYESAENTYLEQTTNATLLDDKKVTITDARVYATSQDCQPEFVSKTLTSAILTNGNANVYQITLPSSPAQQTPLVKLDVEFVTGTRRSLYGSLDENGRFYFLTEYGEPFDGFFDVNANGTTYLIFDNSVFTSISVDNSFTPSGYGISLSSVPSFCDLSSQSKNYSIPSLDCFEVHSGTHAFALDPGKTGTVAKLTKADIPPTEFARKYRASIWVHKSSPLTQLSIQVLDLNLNEIYSSVADNSADPYIQAGNWSMLRVEMDASSMSDSRAAYLQVSVKNAASSGVARYDDLRVLPYNAEMTNSLYDQVTDRVISVVDGPGFVSDAQYDSQGRLYKMSTEVQDQGKQLVKGYLYNQQKQP